MSRYDDDGGGEEEYCDDHVCLSVCLSVSQTFSMHVACSHGLVLLRRRCNTLCTSRFVDDVMFNSYMHTQPQQRPCSVMRGLTPLLRGIGWFQC